MVSALSKIGKRTRNCSKGGIVDFSFFLKKKQKTIFGNIDKPYVVPQPTSSFHLLFISFICYLLSFFFHVCFRCRIYKMKMLALPLLIVRNTKNFAKRRRRLAIQPFILKGEINFFLANTLQVYFNATLANKTNLQYKATISRCSQPSSLERISLKNIPLVIEVLLH